MAIGAIEFATISRAQDYTTIKQNEDNKAMVDQTLITTQNQKTENQKLRDVNQADQTNWQGKQFDARDKGSNEYQGNGGKDRKKKEFKDQVIVNNAHKSFDLKI